MRLSILGVTGLAFLGVSTSMLWAPWARADRASALDDFSKRRRPGTVLYQLKASPTPAARKALDALLKKYALQTVKTIGGELPIIRGHATALQFPREELLADDIYLTGAVQFAEPDYSLPLALVPGESHPATPANRSPAEVVPDTSDGAVLGAICDTGVDVKHPELSEHLVLPGHNVLDGSENVEPVNAHGTMMAGYLAGAGASVAHAKPSLRILPVRVSASSNGSAYVSDMAECVRWSSERGARVVSLSYPAGGSYAIDAAAKMLKAHGGLLFVAAGNEGQDLSPYFPNFRSFVLVGSVDSGGARSRWSNFGEPIDLVAPGECMTTIRPGGGHGIASGTSVSAAIAAGAAASVFAFNASYSPDQVEQLLYATATRARGEMEPGDDLLYGHGRIDVAAALKKAASDDSRALAQGPRHADRRISSETASPGGPERSR